MRRITIWICATLAILAMITYYQVSLSGDGKDGSGGGRLSGAAAVAHEETHSDKPGESK